MAIKETKIVTLFDDSAKEIALAPRTKIEAISDLNGTGLDAILNTKISKEDTVGRNTTGTEYNINNESVIAKIGAEIFNAYDEQYANIASGEYSHAEGVQTIASGDISHAEGVSTIASGGVSHAEGTGTKASGEYSHAEGCYTFADGQSSHSEGCQTFANGNWSHAEGNTTIANGNYSHVEGYNTTASGDYQHVQGKWNIEDTEDKYVHIVGNGTAYNKRSNAHTLDWSGNAWYQGNVDASNLNALDTIRIGNGIMTYDSSNNRIVISFEN